MNTTFRKQHIEIVGQEYANFKIWLEDCQFGSTPIDKYFFGMIARSAETVESMLRNASGGPDNTQTILLRNLFETVVRIRFLALNPNVNIKYFEIAEAVGKINIIGRNPEPNDTVEMEDERALCLSIIDTKTNELREVLGINKNPQALGVEMMCISLCETKNYKIYRILSQYEHSNGMGLLKTVINTSTGQILIGRDLDDERWKLVWCSVSSMLTGINEAVDMLNSHRP